MQVLIISVSVTDAKIVHISDVTDATLIRIMAATQCKQLTVAVLLCYQANLAHIKWHLRREVVLQHPKEQNECRYEVSISIANLVQCANCGHPQFSHHAIIGTENTTGYHTTG